MKAKVSTIDKEEVIFDWDDINDIRNQFYEYLSSEYWISIEIIEE